MKKIKLTRNYETLVDNLLFNQLNKYKWRAQICKNHRLIYAVREVNSGSRITRKSILMHRLILELSGINLSKKDQVDHKNRNSLDNRLENLRITSSQENSRNSTKKKNCLSKYKGVSWRKDRNKWRSYITIDNKYLNLGHFNNEIDAAIAYNNAAKKYFGKFANLNNVS
jgi:hypothetical protein